MKYFILLSFLFFFGCSSDLVQPYTYQPDKAIFVNELGLCLDSTDVEIQSSIKDYFGRFCQNLTFKYQDGKLEVRGDENDIKVFEYVFLTMFENDPKIFVELKCQSIDGGIDLNEKIPIKPYQTKSVKSGESSKSEFEYKVRYDDQIRFMDFAVFEFDFIQFFGEKKQSLSFSSVFKNGEQETFSFNVSEDPFSCNIEGSVKVSWVYENSYFYKSLTNFIRIDSDREVAVMPLLNKGEIEHTIEGSLDLEEGTVPVNNMFEKYLLQFGLKLKAGDVLIYNKNTFNALLFSDKENCQRFRELMSPLCFFQKKKIFLEGEVFKGKDQLSSFKIPVLFNRYTELETEYVEKLNNEFVDEGNLSLSFQYRKEFFEDPIFIESSTRYEIFNDKEDILLDKSRVDNLLPRKQKIINFKKGFKLRLKVSSYKVYE